MSEVPKIWDIGLDGYRDITQADVDALFRTEQAFGHLRTGLKALLQETWARARGEEYDAREKFIEADDAIPDETRWQRGR